MDIPTKVKMACTYAHITQTELARRFGTTGPNFCFRLKRDKFTSEEMDRIGEALGAKFEYHIVFPDGTKI